MGLTIRAGYTDDDGLLGLEFRVWNDRFAGAASLWSTFTQLTEFASCIAGFPASTEDHRSFEFGARDPQWSYNGKVRVVVGYCGLHFRTTDSAAHAVVDVVVEDRRSHSGHHVIGPAKAQFSIPVDAAAIDRFVAALHAIADGRADEAGW